MKVKKIFFYFFGKILCEGSNPLYIWRSNFSPGGIPCECLEPAVSHKGEVKVSAGWVWEADVGALDSLTLGYQAIATFGLKRAPEVS